MSEDDRENERQLAGAKVPTSTTRCVDWYSEGESRTVEVGVCRSPCDSYAGRRAHLIVRSPKSKELTMIVPHDECQRCGSPLPTPDEWPWSLIGGVCPDCVAWFREWAATGDEPVCSPTDLEHFLIGTGVAGRMVICNLAAALPEHIAVNEVDDPAYERERGKKRLAVEIKLPIPVATLREAVVQLKESWLGGKGQLGAAHDSC